MFVELLDSLRCPRVHEESHLVVTTSRTRDRHIVEGVLGCPVCGTEFQISQGQARFSETATTPAERPSAETAMRLAAFLELTDARGFALLCGRWAAHADQIQRLSETPLVLVNPPVDVGGDVAGVIHTTDVVPFAASAARAVALDVGMSQSLIESAVRVVRATGRVVGPTPLALPHDVTELVRDDRMWVAEKSAAPDAAPLIRIKREIR